jgi:hypothetical protein
MDVEAQIKKLREHMAAHAQYGLTPWHLQLLTKLAPVLLARSEELANLRAERQEERLAALTRMQVDRKKPEWLQPVWLACSPEGYIGVCYTKDEALIEQERNQCAIGLYVPLDHVVERLRTMRDAVDTSPPSPVQHAFNAGVRSTIEVCIAVLETLGKGSDT